MSGHGRPGSEGEHDLQEKLGTTKRANAFYDNQVLDHLTPLMREFIERMTMAFIATSDAHGECDSRADEEGRLPPSQPARRRADDRDHGIGGRLAGLRRRLRRRRALGIRPSRPGEALDGRPGELPVGTLVIADATGPLALLFGAIGSGRGVDRRTRADAAGSIQVSGVPDIAVEEALWLAARGAESG